MRTQSNIAKLELVLTCAVWPCCVLYAIYSFAMENHKYFQHYHRKYDTPDDFRDGWELLAPRKKDNTDFEWRAYKIVLNKTYMWIFASLVGSELCRTFKLTKVLPYWQICISIIFILKELNLFCLCVMAMQPIIFVSVMLWKRDIARVWVCNIVCLVIISYLKARTEADESYNELVFYSLIHGVFWMNLKCTGYCLDMVQQDLDKRNESTVRSIQYVKMLAYCFYFPTLFTGPFIPFPDFKPCHDSRHPNHLKKRLTQLILDVIRFMFWYGFIEFMLHFIYVNETIYHIEFILSLDRWSLYGYGYTMAQFFHLKYLVMYGISLSFAKFGWVNTPTLPKCVGRIHLYSDMWKYFDNGLYKFLLKYIYIPSLTSDGFPVRNRFFSSLLCFSFIFAWHGLRKLILIWTILNYGSILLENFVKDIYKRHLQNFTLVKKLGPAWITRIACIIAAPLLAFSALSNFYFFSSVEVGNIFLWTLVTGNWLATTVLLSILYTFCQASTALKDMEHEKRIVKQEIK